MSIVKSNLTKWLLTVIVGFILILSISGFADTNSEPIPIINNYFSSITVQSDALLLVSEKINIITDGNTIKHGIYRDFPTIYKTKDGQNIQVSFNIKSALLNDQPVAYHTSNLSNGIRVYLGNSDRYLPAGNYTFTLTYTTLGQIGFFADHDELYWNVTGNGWAYPIKNVRASVNLPQDAAQNITGITAYTGNYGSRDQDYQSTQNNKHEIIFTSTKPLEAKQGMTIVVGWQKGFVTPPSLQQQLTQHTNDFIAYTIMGLGLLILLLYYLIVWYKHGRDPKSDTIIPEYYPPPNFSPAALRYVLEMGYDDKVFTAAILSLAVKGFLTITEHEKKKYTLIKKADFSGKLSTVEKIIADGLFKNADSIELKQQEYIAKTAQNYKEALKKEFATTYFVKNQKYIFIGAIFSILTIGLTYISNPTLLPITFVMLFLAVFIFALTQGKGSVTVLGYRTAGKPGRIFAFIFPFIFLMFILTQIVKDLSVLYPWVYISIYSLFIVINLLFSYLMKSPTILGQHLIAHIKGFKLFLEATEKDRLNFRNPPQRTPELFEQYLPYALALDVEQKWSEQFSDVLTQANYQPTWYVGSYGMFNASSFTNTISSSFASAISAAATPPGSSSGFGGGGSSGGGGGGGGGGGW